ncbi:MAG: hypothetical protein AAGA41_00380 [Pseudomonadota bacterium]
MKNQTLLRRSLVAATATLASASVLAGGPLNTNPADPDGVERWPNGGTQIPYNIDQGGLGPLSPAEAVALVEGALMTWTSIPTASNAYVTTGQLAEDIDETNFAPFIDNLFFGGNTADGLSPIVFDEDGAIFAALFGPGTGVLGFASTDTRDAAGTPIEAVQFLNGGSILGGFPVADFAGVVFHEFGHYSGLGHTVVNGQNIALGDTTGPSPQNTYGNSPGNQTETMYPFALVGGGQIDPHADDIAFMSFLYPEPGFFANSGTITGTILAPDGTTGLTGVNVIARNVANPFEDAVSAISGDRPGIGGPGTYTLNGLTPGAEYTIHTDQILQGGFSTPPLQPLPGAEEFWDTNESNNIDTPDDPTNSDTVSPVAGVASAGIDIIFNGLAPGDDLGLGDDAFAEVFLPFDFSICGQTFGSVFVNSNGSITFGAGDTDFSESIAEHLLGPPRIAGLFDDLNPTTGGRIFVEDDGSSFSIIYEGVPEFFSTGSNTFTITLLDETAPPAATDRGGRGNRAARGARGGSGAPTQSLGSPDNNLFTISYGTITASDGIAGYSCGGALNLGAETPVDLTEADLGFESQRQPAVFELFSFFDPNDTSGNTFRFGTFTPTDPYEENDFIETASRLRLPFETTNRFTALGFADADLYQFDGQAGQTFVAETSGVVDTVMLLGIILPDGSVPVIAFDDDGGEGTSSALQVPLPEDATYILGVFGFSVFDTGRYGLTMNAMDGFELVLGDDDFAEVDIGFPFTFQGEVYTSVFVNSNGNLTFGSGDTDFSESTFELLNDQPRIAPLWDDLSPNQGGTIIVDGDAGSFSVMFSNVPEFLAGNSNTFTVTLTPDGGISIDYDVLDASDGIAGISAGGGVADPGPTDLSAAPNQSNAGTVYEQFDFINENDLSDLIITYTN